MPNPFTELLGDYMLTPETTQALSRAALEGISIVPMLTPVTEKGALDEAAFRRLVNHILNGGCRGILISATVGEAVSMSSRMRIRMAEIAADAHDGRGYLFFGIGADSQQESIVLGKAAYRVGVDALFTHLPTYYSITEPEIEEWFVELANQIKAPLFLDNAPLTTGHSIPLAAVKRLSRHPNIVGIKDVDANEGRQMRLGRMFLKRKDFAYICGTVASGVVRIVYAATSEFLNPGRIGQP
jgi:dihydrodipicolinate synthase/N-acetylneuraminate lyase